LLVVSFVEVVNLFRCSHGPSCNSFFGNMHSFCNLRGIYFLFLFFSTTLEFLDLLTMVLVISVKNLAGTEDLKQEGLL